MASTTTTTTGIHPLPALFAPPPPQSPSSSSSSSAADDAQATAYTPPHLLTQGAEALVYRTSFLSPSAPAVLKYRPPKPYRHPTLDRRLTRQRILAEARVLVRLRREGVRVPGVLACDWDAGWLLIEFIPGHTIRACLDRYLHAAVAAVAEEPPLPSISEDNAITAAAAVPSSQEQQQGSSTAIDEDAVPELWDLMTRVGRAVGRMHAVGVVHGDLTTSNLMLRTEELPGDDAAALDAAPENALKGTVTIIDFGLASQTVQDEDKAVDLYVLERAFGSTHPAAEPLFREVLRAYGESYQGARPVLKKLEEVRLRGRKRSMLG